MRCLRPIRVYNQSRFIVPTNRDQLTLDVNCGHCANCQRNKYAEWFFRAYKHFERTVSSGGYMYFDSLTYDDDHLPHLSDYPEFASLPRVLDHSCFCYDHYRLAMVRLRKYLRKLGYGSNVFDVFLTSEYGHDNLYVDSCGRLRRGTIRPHYHVLFFVCSSVPFDVFSRLVSKAWSYGRTDGLPYKPVQYVASNVFTNLSPIARRKVGYVSKYVMKSSSFSDMVRKRVMSVLYGLAGFDIDKLRSDEYKRLKVRMLRLVDVFHRQSRYFGLSALDGIDERSLFEAGFFKLPNGKPTMYTRIPISNYFLRKIVYAKVTLDDGYQSWSVRPDKRYLLDIRRASMCLNRVNSIKSDVLTYGLKSVFDELERPILLNDIVDYEFNYKGRFLADSYEVMSLPDRVTRARWFVYSSVADKNHFGMRFVTDRYLGYKDHYKSADGAVLLPLCDFVEAFSINENSVPGFRDYDRKLSILRDAVLELSDDRQRQYDHLQHLRRVLKMVY